MTLGSSRLRPNTKVATRQLLELENGAHYHHRHHRARSSSAPRGIVATIAAWCCDYSSSLKSRRRYVCITKHQKRRLCLATLL